MSNNNTQAIKIAINSANDAQLLESTRPGSETLLAELKVTNPDNTNIQRDKLGQEAISIFLSLDEMDAFAIAWCKHRKLQKYLGGPVGNEWGSPDCPYQ